MKILAIETSCDETAISIVEAKGSKEDPTFKILADTVISQINIHKEYGGVFPALAKREHVKNLLPILITTLKEAGLLSKSKVKISEANIKKIKKILEKEQEMFEPLIDFLQNHKAPKIDAIAVTQGPGLEPALWTGINFAKILSLVWDKAFIPTNHLEGHLVTSLLEKNKIKFPALGLLISGGHTQLILMKDINKFKIVGETRDDAVGEAYDKVARMLGLSYPGGPEISKLSEQHKLGNRIPKFVLPRPMINTPDFDFSFSGLKTAVLYTIKNIPKLTPKIKQEISFEFEEAVADVLLHKTKKALAKYKIKTLILGGGVVANKKIRKDFKDLETDTLTVLIPDTKYTGDNAVMIAMAGYFRYLDKKFLIPEKALKIKAVGNMRLK